jgi:hypothetical protein
VLGLAIAGLLALVVAALTGSTPLAVVVIALAAAGIIQLLRDWRHERGPSPTGVETQPVAPAGEPESAPPGLTPDDFTPDISTDPNGPSSDARADQV